MVISVEKDLLHGQGKGSDYLSQKGRFQNPHQVTKQRAVGFLDFFYNFDFSSSNSDMCYRSFQEALIVGLVSIMNSKSLACI
jgi:hypothetical protein